MTRYTGEGILRGNGVQYRAYVRMCQETGHVRYNAQSMCTGSVYIPPVVRSPVPDGRFFEKQGPEKQVPEKQGPKDICREIVCAEVYVIRPLSLYFVTGSQSLHCFLISLAVTPFKLSGDWNAEAPVRTFTGQARTSGLPGLLPAGRR